MLCGGTTASEEVQGGASGLGRVARESCWGGVGVDPAACEEEVLEGQLREVLHLVPVNLSCNRAEVVGIGISPSEQCTNAVASQFPPLHPDPHVAGGT